MGLAWWQYAAGIMGLALVWFVVEMASYLLGESREKSRSLEARFRRLFLTAAIFVLLFVLAVWAHRWVYF